MAKQGGACALVTRLNLMIPDLPGLGVFRLDTHSFYAASEIGDTAQLLELARDKGVFLPAVLRIDQRQRVADGQTKKYPVPVLEVTATFRQIASGELAAGGMEAQLPPLPGAQRKAITAAPAAPAPAAQVPAQQRPRSAQEIADAAGKAFGRDAVRALIEEAKANRCTDDDVCIADTWMSLRDVLTDAWNLTGGGDGD
jgi:hypothetical protein